MERSPSWEANWFSASQEIPRHLSLFRCLLRDTSSRNTPPPGDPSGGVVYLRIVLSLEEASRLVNIS